MWLKLTVSMTALVAQEPVRVMNNHGVCASLKLKAANTMN
jgi:hypothetical protein